MQFETESEEEKCREYELKEPTAAEHISVGMLVILFFVIVGGLLHAMWTNPILLGIFAAIVGFFVLSYIIGRLVYWIFS